MIDNGSTLHLQDSITQWRIQDFPEVGAPTPRGDANIRFCQKFPKTAWNWKNLDPRGARVPRAPYLDPPLSLLVWVFRLSLMNTVIVWI